MFKVTVALEDKGEFETFPEAFAFFKEEVQNLIRNGTTQMILSEACTISKGAGVLGTHAAIAAAHEWGVLDEEGNIIKPAPVVQEAWWIEKCNKELRGFVANMLSI